MFDLDRFLEKSEPCTDNQKNQRRFWKKTLQKYKKE